MTMPAVVCHTMMLDVRIGGPAVQSEVFDQAEWELRELLARGRQLVDL